MTRVTKSKLPAVRLNAIQAGVRIRLGTVDSGSGRVLGGASFTCAPVEEGDAALYGRSKTWNTAPLKGRGTPETAL